MVINYSITCQRKMFYWVVGWWGALLLHPYSRGLPLWLPASILLPQLFGIMDQLCTVWHVDFLRVLFPLLLGGISIIVGTSWLPITCIMGCGYLILLLPIKCNRDLWFDILYYLLTVLLMVILLGYDNIVLELPYNFLLGKCFNTSNPHLLSFIKAVIITAPLLCVIYAPLSKTGCNLVFPETEGELTLTLNFGELIRLMNKVHFSLVNSTDNYYLFATRTFIVNRGRVLVEFNREEGTCKLIGAPMTIKQIADLL